MFSINPINSSLSTTLKFSKTHESNTHVSTRVPLFSPRLQPHLIFAPSIYLLCNPTKISAKKMGSDEELASDLASEIEKMNTQLAQKEEAMKKSSEILLKEMCKHLGVKESEMKKKWKNMSEDGKFGLVKEFVSEWIVDFHPLSAKSVKEMIDTFLVGDNDYNASDASDDDDESSSMLFPNLLKFMGFS